MNLCVILSILVALVLVMHVAVGSLVGATCGMLSGDNLVETTLPAIMTETSILGDSSSSSKEIDAVASTCLDSKGNGELASAFLGPDRDWNTFFACVTSMPYDSLRDDPTDDGANWGYRLFTNAVACTKKASVADTLLPKPGDPAAFRKNNPALASPKSPLSSAEGMISPMVTSLSSLEPTLIYTANKTINDYIEKECENAHKKFPRASVEKCKETFDETKSELVENMTKIVSDVFSEEALAPIVPKLVKDVIEKNAPTVGTTLGNVFTLVDTNILSKLNCGIIGELKTNLVDGALCSKHGIGGAVQALMIAVIFQVLAFFSAGTVFFSVCADRGTQVQPTQARTLHQKLDLEQPLLLS